MGPKSAVTAIVHTLNEENNIEHCLQSLHWVQEIFVVDSGSNDQTVELARKHTPHVFVRAGNRATLVEQRNWALDNLPVVTDWVLIVDADEIVPADLSIEVKTIVENSPDNIDGYWVRFRNIFLGRWIRHASLYPTWTLRLFRHRGVRYERRKVNAYPVLPPDKEGFLKGHLIHEDKDGIRAFLERAVEFARLEAAEYYSVQKEKRSKVITNLFRIFSAPKSQRRRHLKLIFIRMPFRPLSMFFYLYIIRRGFLDGYPGFVYSALKAIQEWFVNLYIWEKHKNVF